MEELKAGARIFVKGAITEGEYYINGVYKVFENDYGYYISTKLFDCMDQEKLERSIENAFAISGKYNVRQQDVHKDELRTYIEPITIPETVDKCVDLLLKRIHYLEERVEGLEKEKELHMY